MVAILFRGLTSGSFNDNLRLLFALLLCDVDEEEEGRSDGAG
jgi:hypothetical protein